MVPQRLQGVLDRIRETCERSGRDEKEIELVLVTKQVETGAIQEAYGAGIRDFGENKVQEFLKKRPELPQDIRWHLIGHLQTNKVKHVVGAVELIHSCDRIELAEAIQKQAEKKDCLVDVLVQVKTTDEETKFGVRPETLRKLVSKLLNLKHLRPRGLMTIGPFTEDKQRIRSSFRMLHTLREELRREYPGADWYYLSMGMSSDFEIAIEEGANCLRLGTVVFGPRPVKES